MPRRLPPDVLRVLDDFRTLGDAARRALRVSERVTERQVQHAARVAARLRASGQKADDPRGRR